MDVYSDLKSLSECLMASWLSSSVVPKLRDTWSSCLLTLWRTDGQLVICCWESGEEKLPHPAALPLHSLGFSRGQDR